MVKRSSVLIKHPSFQNPKIILAGIKETMLQFKHGRTKDQRGEMACHTIVERGLGSMGLLSTKRLSQCGGWARAACC